MQFTQYAKPAFTCKLKKQPFNSNLAFQPLSPMLKIHINVNYSHTRQIILITFGVSLSTIEENKMKEKRVNDERSFSIELKSKNYLKNVTLTNRSHDSVLLEGAIGELVQATFVEAVILEVVGKKGVLRINLREDEIKRTVDQNLTEVKKH